MAQMSWDVLAPGLRTHNLMFGERPLCTVLRPLMYTPDEWNYLRQQTTTVLRAFDKLGRRMLADPALRHQVRLTPEEEHLIQVDHGYRTPIPTARLDSFFARGADGERTLTFVEFNGESPASMAYQDVLGDLFEEMPVMQAMRERYHMELLRSRQAAVDAILEIYYEWRGNRDKLPDIAIVDWRGVPTTSEFELFVDYFARHGIKALICDPEELEFRNGHMYAQGQPVDFIYKRVLITELLQKYGLDHPIVHGLEAGAICVMNPFTCKVLHKKASFAVASDERNAHLLTPEERQAIQAHIPWTRLVEERTTLGPDGETIDLLPWISQNRERLVLKPNDEYGGKGVVIGWETDQSAWDAALQDALAHPSIVQQRAIIAYEDFPSLGPDGDVVIAQRLVDCDPFLFHGREVTGCLTRLSSVTLLNVTAGGGSIVPVYVVEEKD
ncbi:MAG: hypothetical protein D6790_20395 [Caldilineae bacterium]|nr:MAG: hypothetical protein D6790_20395 [Caldilineae bacterium]